ncbi:hypothetical protein BDW69DRAFT_159202 [Aspergillus filifer]
MLASSSWRIFGWSFVLFVCRELSCKCAEYQQYPTAAPLSFELQKFCELVHVTQATGGRPRLCRNYSVLSPQSNEHGLDGRF